MNSPTEFTVLRSQRELPLSRIGKSGLTTLIGGGLINPFGPTLTALVIDEEMGSRRTHPILLLMLNPFSQSLTEVGTARIGDSWAPFQQIPRFFDLTFGSCPTLLLPSVLLEKNENIELYARFLSTFDDAYSVLQKVRAFPGDPWSRVQQDVDGLASLIEKGERGLATGATQRSLSSEESKELSASLLDSPNLKSELQAFMYAWNGSIEIQGGGPISKRAMSLDDVLNYLALLAMSCDMPVFKQK